MANFNKGVVIQINNRNNSYHHIISKIILLKVANCSNSEAIIIDDIITASNLKVFTFRGFRVPCLRVSYFATE